MIIPHRELSPEALAGIIEEYVTRDGTELGEATEKSRTVSRLLDLGELVVVYDPDADSCNIVAVDLVSAPGREEDEDR